MLKLIYAVFTACLLSACTYSITMVHTEGTATDVVDNNQKADGDVSPTVSIPATAL